jgi:hypothetical protein
MALPRIRPLVAAAALALGSSGMAVATVQSATAATSGASNCFAHHVNSNAEYSIGYTASCSGHDEPELDPVSSLPGSAQDLTWTAVLPTDGTVPVTAVGPTFWFGGTVTDPNPQSLFNQGFLEVQFYEGIVKSCSTDGGFNVTPRPNVFSVCSPTWQVTTTGNKENAAFNAELFNGSSNNPLVMNAGDTIKLHFHLGAQGQGWNIDVLDVTTGQSGTIVLNSKYGPLLPAFSTQQIGNALGWGIVDDTPNSFVWEIGHTGLTTSPAGQFCLPGQRICDSYDTPSWLGFSPLRILSVTFGDGSTANQWAVVSDFGGKAEVNANCTSYGGPFCTYPWFTLNGTGSNTAFAFGADYPGTRFDYGQADQFQQTAQCGGPFGPDSTFCDTVLSPTP